MDFVMHRAPPPPLVSSRGGLPPMSLDHQHSPCPALRAAAERNQLPGLHAQQRGGNGTNYDPVHSSIGGGNWWPHNNHDGWQHPPYSPPHMHSRQIPMYTHAPPFPGPSGLVPPMGTMQAGVQPVPPFGIGGMLGDYYNPHSHSHAHAHPPPRFAPRPNIMGLERVGRTASNQGGQNSNRGNIPEFDGNEQMPRANRLPALSHM